MNQRQGKSHKAALGTDGRISLFEIIEFFELAERALETHGEESAAFYFGQVAEHLRRNPHKGFKEEISRMLGV